MKLLFSIAAALLASTGAAAGEPQVLDVAGSGFAGRYHAAEGRSDGAAVLMLGGSDGGYPSARAAASLASDGHAVLALAYFRGFGAAIPGLPPQLANIPLEYGFRALDWLKNAPGNKGRKLIVMGESRGAELALLIAAHRPDIAGAIAFSPSAVAWPAVGDRTGAVAAWTHCGRPLPYLRASVAEGRSGYETFTDWLAKPELVLPASIPAERISGPILLVSSRSDKIWPAAAMADLIVRRLHSAGFKHSIENLQFDDASHLLMGPGRGLARFSQGDFTVEFGGTEEGTRYARDTAWAYVKRFLHAL